MNLPPGPFDVVLADPPWRYGFSRSRSRSIEKQYATMSIADIAAMPIRQLCAPDAVLFLWATSPKLPQALAVMDAWGFEYKSSAVWDKRRTPNDIGSGYWFRGVHEFLLVGKRGNFSPPHPSRRRQSIFSVPRSRVHSQKPVQVHEWIEHAYPRFRKLELFARDPRQGWTVWGDGVIPVECPSAQLQVPA